MAKKKLTAIQREYRSELRKLKRRIRETGKRGYEFTENIPSRPTKKSIEKIKKYREDFYKYASYTKDGITISGTERRFQERSEASRKAAQSVKQQAQEKAQYQRKNVKLALPNRIDETLINVRSLIDEYVPLERWAPAYREAKQTYNQTLKVMLEREIAAYGERTVALRLFAEGQRIIELVQQIQYDSGDEKTNIKIAEFGSIITGSAFTLNDSLDLTNEVYEGMHEGMNEDEY